MPLYGHIGARRLVRTFIAIPAPEEVVRRLLKLSQQFQWPGCKLRWSTAAQYHLTVQFLGNVEWIEVGKIGKTIKEVAAEFPPLTLELDRLAVFPPQNQPRVVVAALRPNPVLTELVETMQQALLEDHEIVPEKRAYRPHLTVGRVKSVADAEAGAALRAELAAVDPDLLPSFGEWEADELTLFQSDLDGGRAEYIELSHARLAAPRDGEADTEADLDDAAAPARTAFRHDDRDDDDDASAPAGRSVAAAIADARAGRKEEPNRAGARARLQHMLAFHEEEEPADAEYEIDLDAEDDDDEDEADAEAGDAAADDDGE